MADLENVLKRYQGLTDDQLLVELGKELIGDGGLGVGSEDPGRHRRFSRGWLDEQREELCADARLGNLAKPSTGDQLIEIVTITQILSAQVTHEAAVLAAMFIVRVGIRVFCAGTWNE